jgi:anaerobic ribonucleoside-triphosphate reductase activating protein
VAPETLPFTGGETITVDALAQELLPLPDIEGVTFSGGEPMAQASALCRLIAQLRARSDLSFMCYSGYTLEWLQRSGSASQKALLGEIDIFIDGFYVKERHTDLRWKGSDNQHVHLLTPRYQHLAETLMERGTWIDFELLGDGTLRWMGIPPAGFREALPQALNQLGIDLNPEDSNEWLA